MPDLSLRGSHEYWSAYHDKMIYRVVAIMEGVEHWTLDGDDALEAQLEELGQQLDNIEQLDMNELGHEELFVRIAAYIKSSRGLRLLQAIDTVHPGSASKLLIYAEETSESPEDPAGLFLRRNIVFERLRLLGRVFSRERVDLVLRAIAGEGHEDL